MSWSDTKQIWGQSGMVVVNVRCGLDSQFEVNELINELVKAKNLAFPSGGAEHKAKMEALLSGVKHE